MPKTTVTEQPRQRFSLLQAILLGWEAARVRRGRRGITTAPARPRATTPQQAKAIARRRAKNKIARRSRRVNRVRAGR